MTNLLGWLGAVLLLVAYWLVSSRRRQGDSQTYQLLNLVGSVLLIVNTVVLRAYPSAFVNVVWVVIAAYTITRRGVRAGE